MAFSQNEINAGLRYIGTSAATAFTVLAVLGQINPDQVKSLTDSMNDFTTGIGMAVGALSKMWIVLGPVAAIWLGKIGMSAASTKGLISGLLKAASEPNATKSVEVKSAILDAAASLPEVASDIRVTDPALAANTISEKVKPA